MAEKDNALANIDVRDAMSATGSGGYSSLKTNTVKEKALFYNVMSNPEHKVGDYINKTIRVKDVYVEAIDIVDENTGEATTVPRIVLVDTEGAAYQAVSKGIFNSLSRLIRTFGEPTWEDGLPVVVRQLKLGKNQMYSLEVDVDALA